MTKAARSPDKHAHDKERYQDAGRAKRHRSNGPGGLRPQIYLRNGSAVLLVGIGQCAQLAQLAVGLVIRVPDLQWTRRTKEHLGEWSEGHKGVARSQLNCSPFQAGRVNCFSLRISIIRQRSEERNISISSPYKLRRRAQLRAGREEEVFTYLIGCAIEAVPAAALALDVLLGLAQLAGQAADGLRRLGTQSLELHLWSGE